MTIPAKDSILKWLPTVVSIITIIVLLFTLMEYVYAAGQKERRIFNLEQEIIYSKNKDDAIEIKLDKYINELNDANAKLSLLLDYFGIVSEPRGHN